jgi:hypothetical protein
MGIGTEKRARLVSSQTPGCGSPLGFVGLPTTPIRAGKTASDAMVKPHDLGLAKRLGFVVSVFVSDLGFAVLVPRIWGLS